MHKLLSMKTRTYLLIALSLCLLPVRAQIGFNLPFINESAEPELYILEPNYAKDGHIDYYSLANMMKVQYEYDTQRRPVRKILYVMDKHDRRWEQIMITDFIYQNERLVSEQATQLYGEGNPIYRLSKHITYDPASHTDTTRTELKWLDESFEGRIDIRVDQGYTIRHLNHFNLPDSSVYVLEMDGFSYYLKHNYTYNKKQKLVNCTSFNKNRDVGDGGSWNKINEYSITYGKHSIEYTQTTKMLVLEEGESWAHIDSATYEKRLKDVVLKYAMSADQEGRILSKRLVLGGHTIMDSRYTYNEKGQTNVEQMFDLNEQFMAYFGMLGIDGTLGGLAKELGNLRYTVRHQDNRKQSAFYLKQQKKVEINTWLYPDNRLQTIEVIRYDDDGEIDDHDRDEYTYLANGFIEKIEYTNYDEGLEPDEKFRYKEDDKGRVLYEEKFSYNDESKQWEARKKTIYKYDKYGNKCYHEAYSYSSGYSSVYEKSKPGWEGESWNEWVYDANKRKLETRTKIWRDGKWENQLIKQAAYDDKGRETLDAAYQWDDEEQNWIGAHKDSIYFDDAKSLKAIIGYKWDRNSKTWLPAKKTERETGTVEDDDAGWGGYYKERVTSYTWNNGSWQPLEQRVENNERGSSFYSYSIWNIEKQQWIIERQEASKTDENGAVLVEEYGWNADLDELVGKKNTLTIPLDDSDRSNKRVVYRAWNRETKAWEDTVACNVSSKLNNDTYIYEKFDRVNNCWLYDRKVEKKELTSEQVELGQYMWNASSNDWEPDRKMVSYYKDQKPFRYETSIYDKQKKQWEFLYCMEETASKAETIYYKWDTRQQRWKSYLSRNGSGWSEENYIWDDKVNKFVKIDYYRYQSLRAVIHEEMGKINTKISYNGVMGDQY